ncbi:MAG: hypothetical protein QXX08_10140 [Candidatus Bathyarchaeia archaeon]
MAQTGKMQTYQDAINALLDDSVIVPTELLREIAEFVQKNKNLGITTKEEFIRDAIRTELMQLKGNHKFVRIPIEQYERLNRAVREMKLPYSNADDFIRGQIEEVLAKYEKWKKSKKIV